MYNDAERNSNIPGTPDSTEKTYFPYEQVILSEWMALSAGWTIPSESEIVVEYLEREGWCTSDEIEDMLLGFDVRALVFAAAEVLHREGELKSSGLPVGTLSSPTIYLHSTGAFNQVYVVTLPAPFSSCTSQDLQILARLPKLGRNCIPPSKIDSVVATMTFARQCRGLPVPRIFAWNAHYDINHNPVGSPYILMEFVSGVSLEDYWTRLCSQPRSSNQERKKEAIIAACAQFHARLCEPLILHPRNDHMLGSLYFDWLQVDRNSQDMADPECYRMGPLAPGFDALRKRQCYSSQLDPVGPAEDLRTLWRTCLRKELETIKKIGLGMPRKTSGHGDYGAFAEGGRKEMEPEGGRHHMDELAKSLSVGMGNLVERTLSTSSGIDVSLLRPCLSMDDWAFRNIIIDPSTLTIRAVVDWDDVYVLPFLLSGRYPEDLCPTHGDSASGVNTSDQSDDWDFIPKDEEMLVMPFPLPDVLKKGCSISPEPGKTESHEHILGWLQLNERIECTIWRGVYREKMAALDPRFSFGIIVEVGDAAELQFWEFWEISQEAMKVQRLLLYGWRKWVDYSRFIEGYTEGHTKLSNSLLEYH
ncbi:hypothetical protein D9758_008040 [Tetrapyrgos nigripes]|uniref:Altered inheritance of mitochondria protein 9, mitochondrial n=1 Tax=Tetrapyrgos nigripes TaxID=182062 RepID=A0A8H5D248_9AGAR|nr:hypothetical protein D9758_008040 [Tetrapyrgos nigripes]